MSFPSYSNSPGFFRSSWLWWKASALTKYITEREDNNFAYPTYVKITTFAPEFIVALMLAVHNVLSYTVPIFMGLKPLGLSRYPHEP